MRPNSDEAFQGSILMPLSIWYQNIVMSDMTLEQAMGDYPFKQERDIKGNGFIWYIEVPDEIGTAILLRWG